MLDRSHIQEVVYRAIDQVNELLLEEDMLTKENPTIIVGEGAKLDSMGFVNFVVGLEDELSKVVGIDLNFMEELIPADVGTPSWSTVVELIDFLFVMSQKGHLGCLKKPTI